MRARAIAALLVVALGAGCAQAPPLPDVDVAEAPASVPPPRDARLVEAGWPEAAAWIAREASAGRPVVVNLFASWCQPCREELPVLRAAAAQRSDVAFLGVAHTDRRDDAEALVHEYAIPYATLFDELGDVAGGLRARGLPVTAFFGTDGRLVAMHHGQLSADELDRQLQAIRRGG